MAEGQLLNGAFEKYFHMKQIFSSENIYGFLSMPEIQILHGKCLLR